MQFIDTLLSLMKDEGVTAYRLSKDLGISESLIRQWQKNPNIEPSANKVLSISQYFQVNIEWLLTGTGHKYRPAKDLGISKIQHDLLRNFENMDIEKQECLAMMSDVLLGNFKPSRKKELHPIEPTLAKTTEQPSKVLEVVTEEYAYEPEEEFVSKIVYDQRVSAGSGNIFDGNFSCEILSFPAGAVPDQADFGMIISGNSMEPDIKDKQTVWIRRCEELQNGQLGIFTLNGEALCKQYKIDHAKKKTYLVSLNPDYLTILIKKTDELKIIGKVLL